MAITQIIYASSAIEPFSHQDLIDLLKVSRANNESLGVSGMLLYKDGNFFQVLEGESETVERLLAKISADPRHRGVIILLRRAIKERDFANWTMAFRNLNDPEVYKIPGYDEFLNLPLIDPSLKADASKPIRLISIFAENIR